MRIGLLAMAAGLTCACGDLDRSGLLASDAPGSPASTAPGATSPGKPGTPSVMDAGGSIPGVDAGANVGFDAATPPPPMDASTGGPVDAGTPCYTETYFPNATLGDLSTAYKQNAWLSTSLTMLQRRYPSAYFILSAEQGDPNLRDEIDPSSWSTLTFSVQSMLFDESIQYDLDHSPNFDQAYTYALRDDLVIAPSFVDTWTRGEILPLVAGNATQSFDDTYLQGDLGDQDVVFLADDWNAFTNSLAALTAIGDQISSRTNARDGVAASLYYLELFLRVGRTQHPQAYAALKGSADWQRLVRYEWARGFFWDTAARAFANLGTNADAIWSNVNDPANLDEIRLFTGDDAAAVACHP